MSTDGLYGDDDYYEPLGRAKEEPDCGSCNDTGRISNRGLLRVLGPDQACLACRGPETHRDMIRWVLAQAWYLTRRQVAALIWRVKHIGRDRPHPRYDDEPPF